MDRPDVEQDEQEVQEESDEAKQEPQVHTLEVQDGVVGADSLFQ